MKKYVTILILLMMLTSFGYLSAQGFTAPSPGKAVVYFVRASSLGFAIPFEFYHQDKFIGEFAGKNYMRYECEPGTQLFWATAENREFVTAELSPDSAYVVMVDVIMGFAFARVGLTPVDEKTKDYAKALKLVNKELPLVLPDRVIEERNIREANAIREKLQKYEEKKDKKQYPHIAPDMAIPVVPRTETPLAN